MVAVAAMMVEARWVSDMKAFLFLPLLLVPLGGLAAEPLTLEAAIPLALSSHPSIAEAQAAVEAAQGRVEQSNSGRLPQVGLTGNYTYSNPRGYVDFSLPGGASRLYESVEDNYNVALHVSQLVTDFGRTQSAVALARAGIITQQDAAEQVRQQLGYQVIQSFYTVILLREAVGVADEEIRALQESLRINRQKFAGGLVTKYEVLTTQVRIATVENQRADTVAHRRQAEAGLRQLLGYAPATPLELSGDFPTAATVPDLSATLAAGLQNRPEMKLARDAEKTSQLKLDVADRTDRPSLAVDVSGGVHNGAMPELYDRTPYVAAGVSVSVPLFNGHATAGKQVEARAGLRGAEARTHELARQITAEIEGDYARLTASETRLANSDTLVAQAKEALELAKARYDHGVITNFELLDAQSAVRTAELTRVQARYDCVIARQAIARAAGLAPKA
jgi:outer membrane protein TolC